MTVPGKTLGSGPRLRVLIVGYAINGEDVGGVYSAFKWVEALSRQADVTVLTCARDKGRPLAQQLPFATVVSWPEPKVLYRKFERLNAMIKPWFWVFERQATAWIRESLRKGATFDVAHQISPQAMRYPSPLRHFDIPYVIGPLDGSVETPSAFQQEVKQESRSGITRLRVLDRWRLRHDKSLRQSYMKASMMLGVAPYVQQHLSDAGMGQAPFMVMLERGHGILPVLPERSTVANRLAVLHVGRTVRTKALRDTVRAMAYLKDLPEVRLICVGDGPDLAACKAEAETLGVQNQIAFKGKLPRSAVDTEYEKADVFCFPSFREPMGGVLFEAMEWGLPVIAAAHGGPMSIVDESCGFCLPVDSSEQFVQGIANNLRRLAEDPDLRRALGQGARNRIVSFGSWDDKASDTIALYQHLLTTRPIMDMRA